MSNRRVATPGRLIVQCGVCKCVGLAGVNLLTESNMFAGILLNAMFLLGTFTFAVVLGVVSDDISSEVKVCLRTGLAN